MSHYAYKAPKITTAWHRKSTGPSQYYANCHEMAFSSNITLRHRVFNNNWHLLMRERTQLRISDFVTAYIKHISRASEVLPSVILTITTCFCKPSVFRTMSTTDLHARSPFSSRLNTTYIPNDAEAQLAKKIALQEGTRLAALEQEIKRAAEQYNELRNQHLVLLTFIRDHLKMIHPLRRGIPDDILQEIFLHCIPINGFAALHRSKPPLGLTAVCSSWRRVALATPRLWASLHIPIFEQARWEPNSDRRGFLSPEQARELLRRRETVIKRCLALSKKLPLELSLPAADSLQMAIGFPEELNLVLDIFSVCASRMKRLNIDITKFRLNEVTKMTSLSMGLLEELHISFQAFGFDFQDHQGKWNTLPPFSAPHLKQLWFSDFPFFIIPSLPIVWYQITHLCLERTTGPYDVQELIQLLKNCAQLVHCSLISSAFHVRHHHPFLPSVNLDQTVVLHHLKYFDIDVAYPHEHAAPAFSAFQLPALEDVGFFWAGLIRSPLISLVERCNLRVLNTAGALFSGEEFIDCLRECHNLTVLLLSDKDKLSGLIDRTRFEGRSDIDRSDAFLRMLSSPALDGFVLCPRLEVFQSAVAQAKYTDQAVLDFVKAKQEGIPGVSQLKFFSIAFSRAQKLPLAKSLEPYRMQGLRLILRYLAPCRPGSETLGQTLADASMPKPFERYRRTTVDPRIGRDIF
ncbi:hypothetical protein CPB83DRAFT_391763 [Crepidotus variabilis]|uniref:F-box domain-containing protein n=1 Tax=Crepidotus variabilis TaxID=179855 RepID=A0A9P6EEI6_9AGAR|nr:hypothetical protein CPB83DRAFT_391763 [Crepidotus variabilis]